MKCLTPFASLIMIVACVVAPQAVQPGVYESEAGFTVELKHPWSQWASAINPQTAGEYLTKDGPLLNRLHFISLQDDQLMVKATSGTDLPRYAKNASELEIVDFVTASLVKLGYTIMQADNVRPTRVDGEEGLQFDLAGKWKNGLNVSGLVMAVKRKGVLKLVFFLAPDQHYYNQTAPEVHDIMASIDLEN